MLTMISALLPIGSSTWVDGYAYSLAFHGVDYCELLNPPCTPATQGRPKRLPTVRSVLLQSRYIHFASLHACACGILV